MQRSKKEAAMWFSRNTQNAAPEESFRVSVAPPSAELLEIVGTFLGSRNPSLAVDLLASPGARVYLERLGPRQVAVRLTRKAGLPPLEVLGQVRDAIQAKGFKLSALSVDGEATLA